MMAVLRTHRSRLSSTAIAAIVSSPGVTPHHAAGDRAAPAATTRVRLSCAVAPPPRLPTGYPLPRGYAGRSRGRARQQADPDPRALYDLSLHIHCIRPSPGQFPPIGAASSQLSS